MTTVVLKDRELDEYFTSLFEMYGTRGWAKILEDMGRLKEVYNDLSTCQSGEEMHYRQGQLDIIQQILTHQERSEKGYQHALQEQEGGVVDITLNGEAKVVASHEHEGDA